MTLALILARVRAWLELRASMRELNGLTDRELADIGLNRSGIEFAATAARTK